MKGALYEKHAAADYSKRNLAPCEESAAAAGKSKPFFYAFFYLRAAFFKAF